MRVTRADKHAAKLEADLQRLRGRLRPPPASFEALQQRRAHDTAQELLARLDQDIRRLEQRLANLGQRPLAGSTALADAIQRTETYRKTVERIVLLGMEDPRG